MLFFAKFGNNQFDEASSYHSKPFKVNVAVKEIINLGDEMDTTITQKYKKNQAQVSIHVAASHKALQHQTLISQIQIVGPHAILA